jgi:hypothetical protein
MRDHNQMAYKAASPLVLASPGRIGYNYGLHRVRAMQRMPHLDNVLIAHTNGSDGSTANTVDLREPTP